MTDPFASVPGAVLDDDGPLHFGSPHREQRELVAGRAVAVLGDRTVLSISGADRLTWLDSITSQAVAALAPGESSELLVLDPQGRVEHAASVVDDGTVTWLIVDRDRAAALLAWLTRMRFRLRVDPQDAGATHRVIGGTAASLAAVESAATWTDPWPGIAPGGWGYAPADPHPGTEREWVEAIIDQEQYAALAAAAVAGRQEVAGRWAAEALRVAAWRPRAGAEADGRTLPHEVDWLRTAVHLAKGCYRGQETVAKVHNLGHPPRRLIALQLDGSDAILPDAGAEVFADGEPVGAITSVARHYQDGPIALALVKRTLADDAVLSVQTADGVIAASAETIVPPDAGRTAAVPRLPRLSRRR